MEKWNDIFNIIKDNQNLQIIIKYDEKVKKEQNLYEEGKFYDEMIKNLSSKIKEKYNVIKELFSFDKFTEKYSNNDKIIEHIKRMIKTIIFISRFKLNENTMNKLNLQKFEIEILNETNKILDYQFQEILNILTKTDRELLKKIKTKMDYLEKIHLIFGNKKFNDWKNKIQEKINDIFKSFQFEIENNNINQIKKIGEAFTSIKYFTDELFHFKEKGNQFLKNCLEIFINKNSATGIAKLGIEFEKTKLGKCIISEFKCFEGVSVCIFNNKTRSYDIDYVLDPKI